MKTSTPGTPLNLWNQIHINRTFSTQKASVADTQKAVLLALYVIASITVIFLAIDLIIRKVNLDKRSIQPQIATQSPTPGRFTPRSVSTEKPSPATTPKATPTPTATPTATPTVIDTLPKLTSTQVIKGSRFEVIASKGPDQVIYDMLNQWEAFAQQKSQEQHRAYLRANLSNYNVTVNGELTNYTRKPEYILSPLEEHKGIVTTVDRSDNSISPYYGVAGNVIRYMKEYANPASKDTFYTERQVTILVSKKDDQIVGIAFLDESQNPNELMDIVKDPSCSEKGAGESIMRYLAVKTLQDKKDMKILAVYEACEFYEKFGYELSFDNNGVPEDLYRYDLTVAKAQAIATKAMRPFNWSQQVA